MTNLVTTTLRLNPHHPQVRAEQRDVCRMHARIIDATVGMPAGPRVLWARPVPDLLVIRASQPVTPARLPAGYALDVSHRPWRPPTRGRHRAVVVWNPVRQTTYWGDNGERKTRRRPILDRDEQRTSLVDWLGPMIDDLRVDIVDGRSVSGWHRAGHKVTHLLVRVVLTGVVVDPEHLATLTVDGLGRARAYGGGLSLWEKL